MFCLSLIVLVSMPHLIHPYKQLGLNPLHPTFFKILRSLNGSEASKIRTKMLSITNFLFSDYGYNDRGRCARILAEIMVKFLNCTNSAKLLEPYIKRLKIVFYLNTNPLLTNAIYEKNCVGLSDISMRICQNILNKGLNLNIFNISTVIDRCYMEGRLNTTATTSFR